MLRKITRAGQVSVPKKALAQFALKEGDYVDIECTPSAIVLKPVTLSEFSERDRDLFAAKLAELEKEKGAIFGDSSSARKHLKKLMK
jgi:AbrB family looped-hinge helix DNA binding protein